MTHASPHKHTLRLAGAGLTLAADVAGPPEGAPVILMHGGGQTRHAWGGALLQLARAGYHALSLDLRGHGQSDWAPDGDYALDAFCADLRAVIATLPARPALVGASLGGVVSLLALGADPQLASALVMVDVAPRLEPQGVDRITQFMQARPEGFATLEEVAQAVAAYNPHRPPPSDLAGLKKNLRQRPDGRWGWHWDPAFMTGTSLQALGEMSQRMAAAARRVRQPTLLVRGMASDVVVSEGVAEFKALIPHLEVAQIERTGHMVAGDRNDAFNTAVLDFLRRHHPARAGG